LVSDPEGKGGLRGILKLCRENLPLPLFACLRTGKGLPKRGMIKETFVLIEPTTEELPFFWNLT
jgi:hypothetical protein